MKTIISLSAKLATAEEALDHLKKTCPTKIKIVGKTGTAKKGVFAFLFAGDKVDMKAWAKAAFSKDEVQVPQVLKVPYPLNGNAIVGSFKEDVLVTIHYYPGNRAGVIYMSY